MYSVSRASLAQPPREDVERERKRSRPRPPANEPVVARPAVIVGDQKRGAESSQRFGAPTPTRSSDRVPRATPVRLESETPTGEVQSGPLRREPSGAFGSDLISERSLDEVILAYLAEDSEGGE
jgi:hypothetical protein